MEFGDTATIAKVGALVGQGTAALTSFATDANGRHNTDGCVDRFSGREETMLASRFKSFVSIFSREPSLNEAKYGLRGVRVGEVSNPGPQSRVRPRCGEEVAEDVLSSLEFDLTKLDSSDHETLLRPVEGRHVVPRVGGTVPPTVVDSTTLADLPPTVEDSAQQQSTVWPDAQVQSVIMSVQEFPQTTVEPALRQLEVDCKHVATFAERGRRFLGCSLHLAQLRRQSTAK